MSCVYMEARNYMLRDRRTGKLGWTRGGKGLYNDPGKEVDEFIFEPESLLRWEKQLCLVDYFPLVSTTLSLPVPSTRHATGLYMSLLVILQFCTGMTTNVRYQLYCFCWCGRRIELP